MWLVLMKRFVVDGFSVKTCCSYKYENFISCVYLANHVWLSFFLYETNKKGEFWFIDLMSIGYNEIREKLPIYSKNLKIVKFSIFQNFQDFKIFNFRNLDFLKNFKFSKFQILKISKFQNFKISNTNVNFP